MPDTGGHQWDAQQIAQQAVGAILPVDLVTMAEIQPLSLDRFNDRPGMNLGFQALRKDRAQVKVVIALKIDKSAAACYQAFQCFKYRIVLCERM